MDRRNVLQTLGLAAGTGFVGMDDAAAAPQAGVVGQAAGPAQGGGPSQLSMYGVPWDPPDPKIAGRMNVPRVPEDYYTPGRFTGKTVCVTGCARGMGRLAAIRLAREGASVVGVDWLKDEGQKTIDAIVAEGHHAAFVPGDISEDSVPAEMVRVAATKYGGLDAALNNAGVMDPIFPGDPIDYERQKDLAMARIDQASDAYWDVVMRVNGKGTFLCMRHELRQMMKQQRGGSIVNVASVAGLRGFGGTPSYVASKHAVNGLTKNASIDYAPFGIRVNSVNMGTTITPMYERAFKLLRERAASGFTDTGIGMIKINSLLEWSDQKKRGSMPAEQVAVMLFLLSPEASNLTGANFQTDGGFSTY